MLAHVTNSPRRPRRAFSRRCARAASSRTPQPIDDATPRSRSSPHRQRARCDAQLLGLSHRRALSLQRRRRAGRHRWQADPAGDRRRRTIDRVAVVVDTLVRRHQARRRRTRARLRRHGRRMPATRGETAARSRSRSCVARCDFAAAAALHARLADHAAVKRDERFRRATASSSSSNCRERSTLRRIGRPTRGADADPRPRPRARSR